MPKIKSTHVVLEYGKPIYVKDLPKEDQKHLGAYTQNIIHDMLEKINLWYDPGVYFL